MIEKHQPKPFPRGNVVSRNNKGICKNCKVSSCYRKGSRSGIVQCRDFLGPIELSKIRKKIEYNVSVYVAKKKRRENSHDVWKR